MASAKEENKGSSAAMIASLAGAAVGAAVGAGAIILSDKKNRKKLEEALEGLKKQGFDVLDIVSREAETVKSRFEAAKEATEKKAEKAEKKVKAKVKKKAKAK